MLRECCGWAPPPVDAYDAECRLVGAQAHCSLSAWNWRNESALVAGTLVINETREDGSTRTLGQTDLQLTPSFAPGEKRRLDVNITLDELPTSTAELTAHARVWQRGLPLSVHTHDARVHLAPALVAR